MPYKKPGLIKNIILEEDHKRFINVIAEATKLRKRKLYDYNLSYKNFGVLGVTIRMDDKMSRIKNILNIETPNNESLRDSFIDLINYSAMACMILDENK